MARTNKIDNTEKDTETISIKDRYTSCWQRCLGIILVGSNIAVRLYCALYMIISDCDETFNYWEPLNLIFRGFGKQTWEYSPAYAIRSYAYLIPYYSLTSPLRDWDHLTSASIPAYYYFYYVRIVALCGFTAFTEYRLYVSVKNNVNHFVANWYLLFTTFAPGMSHASVALLPSSFAMGWITWATSSALHAFTLKNNMQIVAPSIHAIFCFLVAGLVGWPFALVFGLPFGIFTLSARFQTPPLVKIVLFCTVIFIALVAALIFIDSYFYDRTFLFVPMNIVLYNVFSLEGEGPEIFGVEPFSYYVKNLLLNFNIVFVLGYLGAFSSIFIPHYKLKTVFGTSVPLFIWSFVFGREPHKEERFLYPIYPLICLSAAIFTSHTFVALKKLCSCRLIVRFCSVVSMALYILICVLRILSLVINYSAPITTAKVLHEDSLSSKSSDIQHVCIGREWYHFPTSFFLPDNFRLSFTRSGFDGLLPGDFPENSSLRNSTSAYPRGMNSKNLFSADKVIPFSECDYFIDNSLEVDATVGEAQIISSNEGVLQVAPGWEVRACDKIIKPDGFQRGIGRVLYIPEFARSIIPYEVELMDYCILRKR